jgi:hypothetical protein
MPDFPLEIWFLLIAASVAAAVVVPYAAAALIRDRTAVIDLKQRVTALRKQYEEQMASVQVEDDPEVIRLAAEQVEERKAA